MFDQYVSRYAADWTYSESAPLLEKQAPAVPVASVPEPLAPAKAPVPSRYEFPSAASIPPVSIMNAEPCRGRRPMLETAQPRSDEQRPGAETAAGAKQPRRPRWVGLPAGRRARPCSTPS